MPSPFPGMDPFLEGPEWEDFHSTFNTVLREQLSPALDPKYVVRVERRVYVEHHLPDEELTPPEVRRIDAAVVLSDDAAGGVATAAPPAAVLAPAECLLPMAEEQRETYLLIRDADSMEVVTVIETLSPGNKRRGGDGRREYLEKRESILSSPAHLVELDLLRRGARLPMQTPLPPGDYYAIVSRAGRRPRAQVYSWRLSQPLPPIPIPLRKPDPDFFLDLQTAFTTVYDRALYHRTLRYDRDAERHLTEAEQAWLKERLTASATGLQLPGDRATPCEC